MNPSLFESISIRLRKVQSALEQAWLYWMRKFYRFCSTQTDLFPLICLLQRRQPRYTHNWLQKQCKNALWGKWKCPKHFKYKLSVKLRSNFTQLTSSTSFLLNFPPFLHLRKWLFSYILINNNFRNLIFLLFWNLTNIVLDWTNSLDRIGPKDRQK